jgi:glycosyltransferase involved in cell wall biosynthesis
VGALRSSPGRPPVAVVENTPVLAELEAAARSDLDLYPDRADLEVVYTGEVHVYRGIRTLLHAAATLRDRGGPRVRWTLVGTGKTAAALEGESRAAGLDGVVRFLGWQADLVPFVAQADVAVVPSRSSPHTESTMPNKLYDAMALGRPVVVSDVAPMARVVRQTGAGEVFRSGDAAELAAVVGRFATDAEGRSRASAAGARAVRDRYSWAVDGRVFVDVMAAVAAGSPLPLSSETRA